MAHLRPPCDSVVSPRGNRCSDAPIHERKGSAACRSTLPGRPWLAPCPPTPRQRPGMAAALLRRGVGFASGPLQANLTELHTPTVCPLSLETKYTHSCHGIGAIVERRFTQGEKGVGLRNHYVSQIFFTPNQVTRECDGRAEWTLA